MQNQRTGTGSISQEADVDYVGREINRHAARANDAYDRLERLERACDELVRKWRDSTDPSRPAFVLECAGELELALDVAGGVVEAQRQEAIDDRARELIQHSGLTLGGALLVAESEYEEERDRDRELAELEEYKRAGVLVVLPPEPPKWVGFREAGVNPFALDAQQCDGLTCVVCARVDGTMVPATVLDGVQTFVHESCLK